MFDKKKFIIRIKKRSALYIKMKEYSNDNIKT